MAHRSFTEPDGTQWMVWEVIPTRAERRRGERRGAGDARSGSAGAHDPVLERRRAPDRRRFVDPAPRVRVPEGMELGWLAFESPFERRRLAPIPAAWEDAPPHVLRELAARATPIPSRRRLLE